MFEHCYALKFLHEQLFCTSHGGNGFISGNLFLESPRLANGTSQLIEGQVQGQKGVRGRLSSKNSRNVNSNLQSSSNINMTNQSSPIMTSGSRILSINAIGELEPENQSRSEFEMENIGEVDEMTRSFYEAEEIMDEEIESSLPRLS